MYCVGMNKLFEIPNVNIYITVIAFYYSFYVIIGTWILELVSYLVGHHIKTVVTGLLKYLK